jgi:hypothetical protein
MNTKQRVKIEELGFKIIKEFCKNKNITFLEIPYWEICKIADMIIEKIK